MSNILFDRGLMKFMLLLLMYWSLVVRSVNASPFNIVGFVFRFILYFFFMPIFVCFFFLVSFVVAAVFPLDSFNDQFFLSMCYICSLFQMCDAVLSAIFVVSYKCIDV